jgi:hypothetical protein
MSDAAPHVHGVACEMRGTGSRGGRAAPTERGDDNAARAADSNVAAARPCHTPLRSRLDLAAPFTLTV